MPGELLSYSEAASVLGCGRNKVRELCQTGTLDVRKLGYRTVKVTRRSIDKLISEGTPLRRYRFRKAV